MPICLPTTASGESHVELTLWSVFLLVLPVLGVPTIHVVGVNCHTGRGRVSSPVVKVHASGLRVITQSGRLYDLVGVPGSDAEGLAILDGWATTWDARVLENVTPTLMGWQGRHDVPEASLSALVH